jgi:hypothetical protein
MTKIVEYLLTDHKEVLPIERGTLRVHKFE